MKAFLITGLALLSLTGCDTLPKRDPDFAPVQPADLRPPDQRNGAIYQAGYDIRLFEDIKTRRVGDVLTVRLAEATQAQKQANMDASKSTQISATAPTLFGLASQAVLGHDLKTSIAASSTFEGEGKADQSNRLTGDISVTVVEVLPNGNLRVRGEKRVALNDGDEYVRLSGIVRPVDISTGNIVSSTKIADATIMYKGDGAMADSSKIGWLARFFFSPLFPF
ncbi:MULTISPECIES: flagellar basal body L-ring protein FlgH [Methylomonas]|uniref:flagellar basal body L-ring protein FlgH n=1 Tax=Methylomonas TaxID=416 RepID=UPI001231BCC9|nr:flagellar basal body L-ring protein FlgH [Methylomonas rhizoryzae]